MAKRSARPSAKSRGTRKSDRADDVIELESDESFPASDAPSWTLARIGHPARSEDVRPSKVRRRKG
jgi:hypothetical protein